VASEDTGPTFTERSPVGNRGELDEYVELYDNAVRLHGYSPEPMDKAAVLGFYFMIFGAFPGSQLLRRSAGRREPPPARGLR
jgi:hypothetical protein